MQWNLVHGTTTKHTTTVFGLKLSVVSPDNQQIIRPVAVQFIWIIGKLFWLPSASGNDWETTTGDQVHYACTYRTRQTLFWCIIVVVLLISKTRFGGGFVPAADITTINWQSNISAGPLKYMIFVYMIRF